jgi:ribosomal protein S18 acetylase RimI-like enzyme
MGPLRQAKSKKILAYITLVCGEVDVKDGDERPLDEPDYQYLQYPAIKIARLAVGTDYRNSGLGRNLVQLAMGIAKDVICPAVGCRFVMIDSKRDAVEFYKKCGFEILNTANNLALEMPVMFVDLHKLPLPD